MPTPVGHALAGVVVAVAARRRPSTKVVLACAVAACAPDLDLLLVSHTHRTATHSITAVAALFAAIWIAARLFPSIGAGTAAVVATAYASHIVLDWFGLDPGAMAGVQALWPVSDAWFISPWPLFLETERTDPWSYQAMAANARAVLWETIVLAPIVAMVIRARRGRRETPR